MNSKCKEFVEYIVNGAPQHNKQVVEDDVCTHFHLTRDRKVYHNDYLVWGTERSVYESVG